MSPSKQVSKKAEARASRRARNTAKKINLPGTSAPRDADYFRWEAKWMDVEVSDDPTCSWTWDLSPHDLKDLLEFLTEMSARKWGEIESDTTGGKHRHKKHHDMSVANLAACAQTRFSTHLERVSDGSYDTVFRLRYGGKKRIWGIRDREVFRVLWCDLDHAVYPADPD